MSRVSVDRIASALRQISASGIEGMDVISPSERPPVFDYLLSARFIEEKHPSTTNPLWMTWVLTNTGKDELRIIDRRFKLHMALILFFSIMFAPATVLIYRTVSEIISLPHLSSIEEICSLIGLIGVFKFISSLEEYLDDYDLKVRWKSWRLMLIEIIILIVSCFLSCLFVSRIS